MEAFKKNLHRVNKCSVCCVVKKYEEVMSLNSDQVCCVVKKYEEVMSLKSDQVVKTEIDTDH